MCRGGFFSPKIIRIFYEDVEFRQFLGENTWNLGSFWGKGTGFGNRTAGQLGKNRRFLPKNPSELKTGEGVDFGGKKPKNHWHLLLKTPESSGWCWRSSVALRGGHTSCVTHEDTPGTFGDPLDPREVGVKP